MQTHPIVLGTAGHIDHGKTALVQALTGIDTDRLKVEKERGITTELGFAYLDLEGRRFGVVDVPGHERFVKAMVAGAGGLDLVCLVIAADEGIMPQTREHLDICELLGVRRGVVALTKSDLVDAEWLELMSDEVHSELSSSFLADATIIPVSAKTGAGLDDLRAELVRMTESLPARSPTGALRMPLDRIFTIRGFGTVVTGTILSGEVRTGDAVVIHPRGLTGKVRGLEVHSEPTELARAGMRCAINLSGVARDDLARGDMLSHPDAVTPSHILDTNFRYLRSSKAPLGRRSRVLLHHATAQLSATLVLVDPQRDADTGKKSELLPGEHALVQIRLDATTPIAALPGDHFIVRGFVMQEHYGTTLGGGEILRVQAPKARPAAIETTENMRKIAAASGDKRVALEVSGSAVAAITLAELSRRLDYSQAELADILTRLIETGEVIKAPANASIDDDRVSFCHAETLARLEGQALDHLDKFHTSFPDKAGMSRQELRARLPRAMPTRLFDELMTGLSRREAIDIDRDLVRRHRASASPTEQPLSALERDLATAYRDWGISAPRPKEVASKTGGDAKTTMTALDRLLARKLLVKIKPDYYIEAEALAQLRAKLRAHLDDSGQITPAEWKNLTGASRKYSIPLAEHFDSEKITLRVGDVRKKRG